MRSKLCLAVMTSYVYTGVSRLSPILVSHGLLFWILMNTDRVYRRYGKHLSKEEVEALVAPHPNTVDIVNEWLSVHRNDLTSVQRVNGGSWLTIPISVGQASRMLNTTYNVYQHLDSKDYIVRAISYSLPGVLHPHIDVVSPTTYFGTMRSMKATRD